jgi:hypothetical protein
MRHFEKIINGVTIFNSFIDDIEEYRESLEEYAAINGYTIENDCVMDGARLVVNLSDYAAEEKGREAEEFWNGLINAKM